MTYEGLRLRILKIRRLLFNKYRKKKLIDSNFTIISNNYWGGMIYESYDLPKQSPTVGIFFMASDYIKFLSRLKEYLAAEIKFIDPNNSRWKGIEQISADKRFGKYPIGVLELEDESIEIFFLHYHNEKEAKEKWERRCQRINWKRMLVKFNDQNGCTEEDVKTFMNLPFKNKLFFTCKSWNEVNKNQTFVINQLFKNDFILTSYEPFGLNKYINITNIINKLK